MNEGLDMCGVAAVQRERVAIRQRPTDSGGSEREGGEARDDLHLGEGDELHQLSGHAVIHRVARCQHHGATPLQRADAFNHRGEGLRPFMNVGGDVLRQEAKQAGRADDGFGLLDGETGADGKALPAVLAHADDGEPFAHWAPRVRALTTEAAMAEPPRRPSSVA